MKFMMMTSGFRRAKYLLVGVLCAAGAASVMGGQIPAGIRDWDDGIKYSRGQNVVPVFEGWVANPDGTFSLLFGSFNRNWEENVFIPVGPDNRIEPGGPDRGQPTVFTPRRDRNLFEVVVPKDFGNKEVVWTLTSRGRTERAFGALVPQEVLTRRMVLAGAGRDFSDDDTGDERSTNQPPTVTIDPVEPVTRPNRATLAVSVTDDGNSPSGYAFGRGSRRGASVGWSTYRGPAMVAFAPAASGLSSPKGGKVTTVATFAAPGTYLLRATATDVGGYITKKDVTVVVK
jgi:hypothetical protein